MPQEKPGSAPGGAKTFWDSINHGGKERQIGSAGAKTTDTIAIDLNAASGTRHIGTLTHKYTAQQPTAQTTGWTVHNRHEQKKKATTRIETQRSIVIDASPKVKCPSIAFAIWCA